MNGVKTQGSALMRLKACLAALLLALAAALLVALPQSAFADATDTTLTVDANATAVVEGDTYTDIQSAINYISENATDKTGWTITVAAGEYSRFTVLDGLSGLTVSAQKAGTVTVKTLDGSPAPAPTSGGYPDTGGVSIRNANNVTLNGLTFSVGSQADSWVSAAVSNYSESTERGDNFTVSNCTFTGVGVLQYGVFVNAGTTQFKVTKCSFSGLKEAISMYGDGTLLAGAQVTGNTFTNCSFAIHGYYGGTGEAGVLTFANNKVTGSDGLRCKIVIQDQTNTGAIKVDVSENELTNAIVGLVNLRESGECVSDVLSRNTIGNGTFYVEAVEPGTIDFYTSYQAPDNGTAGRWVLTGIEDYPDGSTTFIQDIVDRANLEGSHVLNITGIDPDNLIKTFTWFKDGIYWDSYAAGDLTITKSSTGDLANAEDVFEFTVTLTNDSIVGENVCYDGYIFDNGVATIKVYLQAGKDFTIEDIPAGTTYKVVETDAKGYTSTATNAEGTIAEGVVATASFVNDLSSPEEPVTPTTPDEPTKIDTDSKPLAKTGDSTLPIVAVVSTIALIGAGVGVGAWRKMR